MRSGSHGGGADAVGLGEPRILELLGREVGLHLCFQVLRMHRHAGNAPLVDLRVGIHAAGVENAGRIEYRLDAATDLGEARLHG